MRSGGVGRDGHTLAVLPAFPPSVERVYEAGGLSNVIRQRLAERGFTAPRTAGRV
jgi:hypothetical protein